MPAFEGKPRSVVAPYGCWKSPITSDMIVGTNIGLIDVVADGDVIYWIESRPLDGGRYVVVQRSRDGTVQDVTQPPFNARTRVHEYGGAAVIAKDGIVYFSNFDDQKLFRQDPNAAPRQISKGDQCRYADASFDGLRNRLICVREDHSASDGSVTNTIAAVSIDGTMPEDIVVSGNDFYSNPRVSFDGSQLAWLTWNHPSMPWIGTELWIGDLAKSGVVESPRQIAGGTSESIFQPEWSPTGNDLFFVSDRTSWWNLYRYAKASIQPVKPMAAEFGQPQWYFGTATYAFTTRDRIVCAYVESGRCRLALMDLAGGSFTPLEIPYTEIANVRAYDNTVLLRAGAPDKPTSIVKVELAPFKIEVLRRSTDVLEGSNLRDYLSDPSFIEFPSDNDKAFGWYYPPHNPDYSASISELPPLIVKSHGGPTAAASSTLDLRIQYWTSRGYAVVDVDYGGSTGYGREFRNRLHRAWGLIDVEDCTNAAKFLANMGKVDGARVAITGGSAGGYTTLCALTFKNFFRIGASYYGIGDLEALARDTHKFESHYMDWLVGIYPDEAQTYRERSPINYTERLSVPIILFQGSEDKIVPPNQAELMVNSIRGKGLPLGYFLFEGEQHGFRKGENIKRALDAELYFYSALLVRAGLRY